LKRRLPKEAKGLAVDGLFGAMTQDAYRAWQRRCGFRGSDADGIPGKISLQRLGFDVK
jgi:peptidoglycan hydrolase-like protein with peptidoglycan-binding domain